MTKWKTKKRVEHFDIDKYVEWRTFMLDIENEIKNKSKFQKSIMEHNGMLPTSNIKTGLEHVNTKGQYWV